PRAITRDPDSEASKMLKARGVELVKADAVERASLVAALHGSEAVFAVRWSWADGDTTQKQTFFPQVTMPVFLTTEGKGEDEQGKT
ncbi:hypothetical protein C8R45DRAFT_847709, partial [Mycena sanguinolenta]